MALIRGLPNITANISIIPPRIIENDTVLLKIFLDTDSFFSPILLANKIEKAMDKAPKFPINRYIRFAEIETAV